MSTYEERLAERRLARKAIRKAERRVAWGLIRPEDAEKWAARYVRRKAKS